MWEHAEEVSTVSNAFLVASERFLVSEKPRSQLI